MIVRSTRGAFQIASEHRDAMRRALAKLDGTRDLETALGGERPVDAFYILRMLGWFAQSGLIIDGDASGRVQHTAAPRRPTASLEWLGSSDFSERLRAALEAPSDFAGARTARSERRAADVPSRPSSIIIGATDGLDFDALERMEQAARRAAAAFLPVFPFGDAIVVGPLSESGAGPCLRCFELHWLGASPSIMLERAYLGWARGGGGRAESSVTQAEIDRTAAIIGEFTAQERGGGLIALISRNTLTPSNGRIDPHPLCPRCTDVSKNDGRASAFVRRVWFQPSAPLAAARDRVEPAARGPCPLVAIAPNPPWRLEPAPGAPQVVVGRFALPDPEAVAGRQSNWCHGAAADARDARALAIIEGLERYAGSCPPRRTITAAFASIADRALDPRLITLFSPSQCARPGFPFSPFDPERPTQWTWGADVSRERAILVPAAAAWYSVDDCWLSETSSGVSAHSGTAAALLGGALELIERDAFLIFWLNRLSPPLIETDEISGAAERAELAHIARAGYRIRLADLTTDLGIPVVLALGFREDRRAPALIVGAGAGLTGYEALARALKELYAATLNPTPLWMQKPPLAMRDVRELDDHALAYEHPDWLPHASFLWASERRTLAPHVDVEPPQSDAERLGEVISRLEQNCIGLIGVDLTPPEFSRLGIKVVRAIAPGLQPLGFADRIRLGGRRLYEAPVRMGYLAAPKREEELNVVPHCFP